jgi:putative hydrolase of the HAD superfamily
MLKAVIFDLDDTLIDWSGLTESWESVVLRHVSNVYAHICECYPLDSMDDYVREFQTRVRFAWNSARDNLVAPNLGTVLIESAVALGVPPDALNSRACMEAYRWGAVAGSKAFPETATVLGLLRAKGLKLGLVTNAFEPMWVRDPELEAHGLSDYFTDCRFSAADFGYLKPHPSIFRACMDCLGTQPDETVFVGDDLDADIAGAQKAGVFAVLRRTRRTRGKIYGPVQPNRIIDSLNELAAVFDEHFPGWGQ